MPVPGGQEPGSCDVLIWFSTPESTRSAQGGVCANPQDSLLDDGGSGVGAGGTCVREGEFPRANLGDPATGTRADDLTREGRALAIAGDQRAVDHIGLVDDRRAIRRGEGRGSPPKPSRPRPRQAPAGRLLSWPAAARAPGEAGPGGSCVSAGPGWQDLHQDSPRPIFHKVGIVICWDLDETLGHFRSIEEELGRLLGPDNDPSVSVMSGNCSQESLGSSGGTRKIRGVSLRTGMAELLRQIKSMGLIQVVTTGAIREYAHFALESEGIAGNFQNLFARDEVWDRSGKLYSRVIDSLGVDREELLIIGDDFLRDRDAEDLARHPVMICEVDGVDKPAGLLLPIIEWLSAAPSVWSGFQSLLEISERQGLDQVSRLGHVQATITFWGNYDAGDRVPILTDIRPLDGQE